MTSPSFFIRLLGTMKRVLQRLLLDLLLGIDLAMKLLALDMDLKLTIPTGGRCSLLLL